MFLVACSLHFHRARTGSEKVEAGACHRAYLPFCEEQLRQAQARRCWCVDFPFVTMHRPIGWRPLHPLRALQSVKAQWPSSCSKPLLVPLLLRLLASAVPCSQGR